MADDRMPNLVGPVQFPLMPEFASCGIYFLYHEGVVVYVGQAQNMRKRIGQHLVESVKTFDAIACIRCDAKDLNARERKYIGLLVPKYNNCSYAKNRKEAHCIRGLDRLPQRDIVASSFTKEEDAADFLGITIEEMRRHRKLGHGPITVRRPRSNERRYPIDLLRQFAAEHLT